MRIEMGKSLEVAGVSETAAGWLVRLNGEGADVELDASAVQRLDSAGAQLILSLEREVRGRSGSLTVVAASPAFTQALTGLGLHLPQGAA